MCKKILLNNLNGQKTIKDKNICLLRTFALCLNEPKDAFIEFLEYPCPFKDCNHTREEECCVKKEVLNKNILESRYANYLSFIEEVK